MSELPDIDFDRQQSTGFPASIFIWPILLLLPSSILFLIMDRSLAIASGGRETPEFIDASTREGMGGGLAPIMLATLIGSVIWFIAFGKWIQLIIKDRKPHWPKALALLTGSLSHIWVMGYLWDLAARWHQ